MTVKTTNAKVVHTKLEMTKDSMPWSSLQITMENTEGIDLPRPAVIKAMFSDGSISPSVDSMEYTPEYGVLILDLNALEKTQVIGGPDGGTTARERLDRFRDIVDLRFTGGDRDRTIILPYIEQYGLGSENSLQKNTIEDGLLKIEWGIPDGQE